MGMRRLSFAPQKERGAFQNPFLRLGTALLAPLALACPNDQKAAAPQKQAITGTYDCVCTKTKISAYGEAGVEGSGWSFSIHENNGSFFLVDDATRMLRQFGVQAAAIPVTPDENGFHLVSKSPAGVSTITGRFSGDGSLAYSKTRAFEGGTTTFEGRCTKIQAGEETGYMKAVFIRPGRYDCQFYDAFGKPGEEAVTVGHGTLESTSKDFLKSGVTDIFIAFKTDGPWSALGHHGDLLYDSRHDSHEEGTFVKARERGFEPIGAFMNSCRAAYVSAGKKVRFHAWFPVFADEHAARFGFQTGDATSDALGNAVNAITRFLSGKKCDCRSNIGAEPSNPMVVEYELMLLEEIMVKYPSLSGINLDYIRYLLPNAPCYVGGDAKKPLQPHAWNVDPTAIEGFVKKVRAKFPGIILSADVLADAQTRQQAGQEGMLQYLDMIIPMVYSYTDNSSSSAIVTWVTTLRSAYPSKKLLPLLRGWSKCITNPHSKGLIADLTADLSAVKTVKIDGYGIFTYEFLLEDAPTKKLSDIRKKIGY